jgi:hypothetical protein
LAGLPGTPLNYAPVECIKQWKGRVEVHLLLFRPETRVTSEIRRQER